MTLVRPRLRGQGPNLDATAAPRESATPAQSIPVITCTPNAKDRAAGAKHRAITRRGGQGRSRGYENDGEFPP